MIKSKRNKDIVDILGIFIASRMLLVLLAFLWNALNSTSLGMNDLLNQWDTGWYLTIIENGYDLEPLREGVCTGQANWAFFPLYPMIVRFTKSILGISAISAGVLVSNICAILLLFIGVKYFELTDRSNESKWIFIVLVLLGPYSIYLTCMYTEALFMLLVMASFYYMKKKKWLLAGVMACLASSTRIVGVMLIIPLVINMYQECRESNNGRLGLIEFIKVMLGEPIKILSCLLVPGGIFAYMYYLYTKIGDVFAFKNVQIAWGRENSFIQAMKNIVGSLLGLKDMRSLFLSCVIVIMICIGIRTILKRRYDEGIFGLILLAIPLLSSLDSLPRYGFGSVVLLIGASDIISNLKRETKSLILGLLILTEMIMVMLWYYGHILMM